MRDEGLAVLAAGHRPQAISSNPHPYLPSPYSWLIFCWALEKYCQPVHRVTSAAIQSRT